MDRDNLFNKWCWNMEINIQKKKKKKKNLDTDFIPFMKITQNGL